MENNDLIFDLPNDPTLPARLVFGDDGGVVVPDAPFVVRGQLPSLRARIPTAYGRPVVVQAQFQKLKGRVRSRYFSATERPLVNETTGVFEAAVANREATRSGWEDTRPLHTQDAVRFEKAIPEPVSHAVNWNNAEHVKDLLTGIFQQAKKLPTAITKTRYQDTQRAHNTRSVRYQEGAHLNTQALLARYQDAQRDIRNFTAVRFQQGVPYSVDSRQLYSGGVPLFKWWLAKYQEAVKPPIGIWRPKPPEPDKETCYSPLLPANLVFQTPWLHNGNLVFICDRHDDPPPEPGETVVVPVKEVYLTINSAVLVRVDTGQVIPCISMSMQLDVDSWTWGFSASVPGSVLPLVQRSRHGDPVVVQATINGIDFRFALDTPTRDRSFNSSSLRLQGRGLGAELDAPNSVVRTFTNAESRNARQLLDDILTYNNVPIGWEIGAFEPTDWAVPKGVFNHTGTYISALRQVAEAAGAYLQPHNTARTLDVRLRYPKPYWEWGSITPDFEIPEAVATQEGITWEDKPIYNRVFVVGQEHGVIGQYTRTGTAGDLLAQTVIDPLITHADAARQRGRSIISDTGRVATVSFRMPLLAETGVIKPGAFVRYLEGGNTHFGLTRSVQLDVSDLTGIHQRITMETHLEPV